MPDVMRGFGGLPCPRCGELDSAISVDLDNVLADAALQCPECEATFGVADLEDLIARWQRVIVWLKTAPEID